jgi:hypothetical protein
MLSGYTRLFDRAMQFNWSAGASTSRLARPCSDIRVPVPFMHDVFGLLIVVAQLSLLSRESCQVGQRRGFTWVDLAMLGIDSLRRLFYSSCGDHVAQPKRLDLFPF